MLRCGKCGTAGGSNTAGVGWRRWLVPPLPAVPHAVAFTLLLPFLLLCSDGVMDSLERFLLIATNSDDVTRAIDFAALDRVAAAARTQYLGNLLQNVLRQYTNAAAGIVSDLLSVTTKFAIQVRGVGLGTLPCACTAWCTAHLYPIPTALPMKREIVILMRSVCWPELPLGRLSPQLPRMRRHSPTRAAGTPPARLSPETGGCGRCVRAGHATPAWAAGHAMWNIRRF